MREVVEWLGTHDYYRGEMVEEDHGVVFRVRV